MKIANKKILVFVLISSFLGFMAATGTMAGSLWDSQQGMGATSDEIGAAFGQTSGTPTDIWTTVALIVKVFLGFLGIIFFGLMLWAGFKWMGSRGNESTINEAKSQMGAAVIGLIIILMSYAIASFVSRCFFDISTGNGSSGSWMCVF
ncbi:MAG: hypothetical protein V1867_03325 [Candidatus Falkowbacteria bacterium]